MAEHGCWVQHPITGDLIPKHLYHRPSEARSALAGPMLIRDGMDQTWNPANGRHYDSKSQYYRDVKASGAHIIEKGERPAPRAALPDPIHDIKQVIEQVESRTPTSRPKKRKKA